MDNLTHSLVGLAAAKAGLERTSPYATVLCVVAANAPDADLVTLVGGRWTYLHQHRGLSHSVLGMLTLALLLPLLFYAGDVLVARLRRRRPRARLRGLLLASLVLCASHPLMDWTNNYGVRPFLPWDSRWFYGDLVFIIDPWLWLSVGGAAALTTAKTKCRTAAWAVVGACVTAAILFLPQVRDVPYPFASRVLWAAGVAGLIAAHRAGLAARWGEAMAASSLALVVVYWGALALLHAGALRQSKSLADTLAAERGETLVRVAAMPMLADPLRWRSVAETNRAFLRFDVKVGDDARSVRPAVSRFDKPQGADSELVSRAARGDARAAVFLDFARFPAARLTRNCAAQTLVQFADLRFAEPGAATRGGNFTLELPVGDE